MLASLNAFGRLPLLSTFEILWKELVLVLHQMFGELSNEVI
jgi:hypothetical protein